MKQIYFSLKILKGKMFEGRFNEYCVIFQQAQLQAGTQSNIVDTSQSSNKDSFKNPSINPEISAIVNSLMNSTKEYQQQVAGIYC